jgi:hypothetical protein
LSSGLLGLGGEAVCTVYLYLPTWELLRGPRAWDNPIWCCGPRHWFMSCSPSLDRMNLSYLISEKHCYLLLYFFYLHSIFFSFFYFSSFSFIPLKYPFIIFKF